MSRAGAARWPRPQGAAPVPDRHVRQLRRHGGRRFSQNEIPPQPVVLRALHPAHDLAGDRQFLVRVGVPRAGLRVLRRGRLLPALPRLHPRRPGDVEVKVPFLDLQAAYLELQAELDAACRRVMASGWYILGQEVEAFESEFAAYCGVRHCVGVSNGLDALQLILRGYGIGAGDEVIVPANTFIATWLAVSRAGAMPVPVEPNESTHTIEAEHVETAITSRTRAVMPVHLYGQPADMQPICDVAHRHGLKVIEDAAQAHGARYRGQRAGGWGMLPASVFIPARTSGPSGMGAPW